MGNAKENIETAYKWAFANRPKANGFPFLAEVLKQAGVTSYTYNLPSCQCIYVTKGGCVASQMDSLISGTSDVPRFDREAFLKVLRSSQAGEISFPEFLKGSWETGVIRYEVNLIARKVSYFGVAGECYIEDYPSVEIKGVRLV